MMPRTDLRLTHLGVLGQVTEVRPHRQLQAASQGVSEHRRDHRLGQPLQPPDDRNQPVVVQGAGPGVVGGLELVDVGARREVRAAGDDHRPNLRTRGLIDCVVQILHQLPRNGVDRRTGQLDDPHRALGGI